MNFYIKLILRLISDIFNPEEIKFPPRNKVLIKSMWKKSSFIKEFITRIYNLKNIMNLSSKLNRIFKVYNLLEDDYSKKILIELMSGYILSFYHVKLSLNNSKYWMDFENVKKLITGDERISYFINSKIIERKEKIETLNKFNLKNIGFPIKLFNIQNMIMEIFLLQQYRYNHDKIIDVEEGDFVIDVGGCWGDTALYFANKIGKSGRVYSFEFIPSNINIFKKNLNLNPHLKDIIQIVEKPLWRTSDEDLFFINGGPGSAVSLRPFENSTTKIKTITIDNFVKNNNIPKVDFIKMDIEGAEFDMLAGAKEVIIKYRPKLAISIYHNINHFFEIPHFINSLNLNYKFYLDHFSTIRNETILFSKVDLT